MNAKNLRLSSYISEEQLQKKVAEIGAILTDKFMNKKVTAVCVLKGSFIFYSDLIRQINTDITCEFFGVSSYSGMTSSGEVKITLDLTNKSVPRVISVNLSHEKPRQLSTQVVAVISSASNAGFL